MPNELETTAATDARPTQPQPQGMKAAACPTDLSITCPECGTKMQPEHAHYRCLACGFVFTTT